VGGGIVPQLLSQVASYLSRAYDGDTDLVHLPDFTVDPLALVSVLVAELVGKAQPSPAKPTEETQPRQESHLFVRIAGLCMCGLGIACLLLAVAVLFIDPQVKQSIATSVAVTIDGFGVVYGMSALAVIVGVYLMIRKP
jgi:hypothetical protein